MNSSKFELGLINCSSKFDWRGTCNHKKREVSASPRGRCTKEEFGLAWVSARPSRFRAPEFSHPLPFVNVVQVKPQDARRKEELQD